MSAKTNGGLCLNILHDSFDVPFLPCRASAHIVGMLPHLRYNVCDSSITDLGPGQGLVDMAKSQRGHTLRLRKQAVTSGT